MSTTSLSAPDIRRPEAIDAAWLTAALQAAGVDAEVGSFTAKAVGTGQIGDSVRFALDYARGGENAPASLVGKFPSADPTSYGTGVALGNYHREIMFYQQLAPTARIHLPKTLMAEIREGTGEFVLLMEDLAPAEQGDQLQGLSLDRVRIAIDEAAKLHSSHWQDPWLDTLPWVSGSAAAPASAANPGMVQALWQGFVGRYGPRLKPEWIRAGESLIGSFGERADASAGPRCLTHNDYRPDNMMFATPAGGYPMTMLDWQSFAYGTGATDVAYFLAGAVSPEVRRAHEPELLARYHAGLTAGGVTGYSKADLARDYGKGAYLLFTTAFFASMIVKQTDRGDEMFLQMIESATQHMLDHGAV